ncbi:MAG: prepilin peptidase [Atopobiaceae bacterium]|nr:prepilin peptidase [Atopobiaceae bacterium]
MVALGIEFYESAPLTVGVCLIAFVLGLFGGSIIHTVMWRSSHDNDERGLIPSCHQCGHPLTLREALPVVGWLSNKGVCPHCGDQLGADRLCTELLCGGIFASVVLRHGMTVQALEVLGICCLLLAISLSTLWNYRIPNSCILLAIAIRSAYLVYASLTSADGTQLVVSSLVGAVAVGIPLAIAVFLSNAMLARDITGAGTVKLVGVVGFCLGWQQGLCALASAFALEAFIWLISPYKLLDVEVEGGAHRNASDANQAPMPSVREMRSTMEEDISEPMRVIPIAPAIAIACWVMLLIGVAPSAWNAPIF